MKHLFIINPAAGKKESTAYLEGLLKQLPFPHEVEYTRGAGGDAGVHPGTHHVDAQPAVAVDQVKGCERLEAVSALLPH